MRKMKLTFEKFNVSMNTLQNTSNSIKWKIFNVYNRKTKTAFSQAQFFLKSLKGLEKPKF